MKKRTPIENCPSLPKIHGYQNVTDSQWCSNFYKSVTAYEYYDKTLADDLLVKRRMTNDDPAKHLTEPEMWYFVRNIAQACDTLNNNGILHGDIQPRHIFLTPEDKVPPR